MTGFPAAARESLADSQLRANLARATSTIRDKRGRVVDEVADWEELRSAGAAIKDAALLQLDRRLTQLESSVQARGGTVHWARDGIEACSIVAEIARARSVDEVVKVKSIATDEIGLNEHLAASVNADGSSVSSSRPSSRRKMSLISARFRWIAGTRM